MLSKNNIDMASIFASSAHDIKNTLALLLNLIAVAIDETHPDSKTYKTLSLLRADTLKVINQLVQLLTIYSLETSRYMLNIAHHNIREFMEDLALQNKYILDIKGISIDIDCPEDDLYWFFDRDMLIILMNSVLTNKYQYTNGKIAITINYDKDYLYIQIDDNGPGYPQNIIEDIMTQKPVNPQTKSTGLGIFFASMIAQAHKNKDKIGSVKIENGGKYGGGSFIIKLP
ncbi:MAG: HAMP domain-containing histidine kinase [Candidatus Magnetoovum sp. WYHC-5]|nr:HAMP domain-containing histidine kinase [Candidatus Magnetoovum sp. WYHC-5]